MHNARSGARRQQPRRDEEVLSPVEAARRERGRALKRYIRAAAARRDLYDDTALGEAIGLSRGAVGAWWDGAQMKPDSIQRLAEVIGVSFEELTRFVYLNGRPPELPLPSGPAGLQEGVRRGEERPDVEVPDMPARSPGRRPPGAGAGSA